MEEKCPNIVKLAAGEDESMDGCEVNENRMCVLEVGEQCETWEEIKREWEEEEKARSSLDSAIDAAKLKPGSVKETYNFGVGGAAMSIIVSTVDGRLTNVEIFSPDDSHSLDIPGRQLERFIEIIKSLYDKLEEDGCLPQ